MNLGDVKEKSVPKMMLVAPPRHGGAVTVRSFIPHRAHATIGVLGAVSVATACLLEGSPAARSRTWLMARARRSRSSIRPAR
jgi:4-oxalomesaconate tautomerase